VYKRQVLDIVITLVALVILLLGLALSDLLPHDGLSTIAALLFFFIRSPYYTLFEILWNGQTPGKRLLGMRVISGDGRSLTPHAITVRNLMKEMEVFAPGTTLLVAQDLDWYWVLLLAIWIAVLLAVPLANRHRQRLGDIIANTYVVAVPRPLLLPDLADTGPGADFSFLPHHLDHYGRYELQTLETLLQVQPEGLSRAARKQHDRDIAIVTRAIVARTGFEAEIPAARNRDFLLDFYRTQRAYLENRKIFGDAREDKFHAAPP